MYTKIPFYKPTYLSQTNKGPFKCYVTPGGVGGGGGRGRDPALRSVTGGWGGGGGGDGISVT